MRALLVRIGLCIPVMILPACISQELTHDAEHSHGADAETADERPTIAVTSWTDRSELFMEYPALVADETGRFAIHVTDLSNFTPATSGEAVVVLRATDGTEQEFRGGLSRPGIFGADVIPSVAGLFEMKLRIDAPTLQDIHDLGAVTVHGADSDIPPAEDEGEAISFLKEQQWTLEFATEKVTMRTLQPSLVVPGTVRPRAGGEALLSAPVSGRIDPSSIVPVPGERARMNQVVARIVPHSEGTTDAAGLRADLVEAKQLYELAGQERDRAARLVEARALPARRLEEAEAALIASKARLDAATQRMNRLDTLSQSGETVRPDDWFTVRAPFDAAFADVRFSAGANVEEGDLLARLVETSTVHLVGTVPESRSSRLKSVNTAELIRDEQLPVPIGQPVAIGEVVEPASRTVEVRYEMDNREQGLLLGQGVRLRLFFDEAESLPAVPESAVVDDGGRLVVFVQTGGESFERRPVRLGSRGSGYVHALEGVEPGERVVSQGAFLVRLAAMSTQIPAHGHVH